MADVAIVMGSDSDWPTMESAATTLAELGITYEVALLSAHRMPEEMMEFGKAAAARGFKVIIAGAGGAAHLPGMLASISPLKALEGMDSLLSIVQMPAGIPVATVGIGNAKNAGLLAARILGAHDERALAAIKSQMERMHTEVLGRAENLKRASQGE
jgi:5-(carboxyamino)imidazole ribonucleotide mutase